MRPGAQALLDLLVQRSRPAARALVIGGPAVIPVALASRRVEAAREDEALALLGAHAADPYDAIVAAWPTGFAPLMPFLAAAREALIPGGEALVCDLVWQTAPTLELLRAFAPAQGREKVRPIEGWEMQAEHNGFEVVERGEVARASWALDTGYLSPEQRAALADDARGAARLAWWALRRTAE